MAHKKYRPKQHISVKRKKEEALRLAERRRKFDENKKTYIKWAVIALVAILAVITVIDMTYAPNGSQPVFWGKVMGVGSQDIVRNLGSKSAPVFYKMATVKAPAGYEPSAKSLSYLMTDDREQIFNYEATDEESLIRTVMMSSANGVSASDMILRLHSMGYYEGETHAGTVEVNGRTWLYYFGITQQTDADEVPIGAFGSIAFYTDTVQDSSVLVNCNSKYFALDAVLPTEQEMLDAVLPIVELVTLPANAPAEAPVLPEMKPRTAE